MCPLQSQMTPVTNGHKVIKSLIRAEFLSDQLVIIRKLMMPVPVTATIITCSVIREAFSKARWIEMAGRGKIAQATVTLKTLTKK